ncbi:MAG: hypothetical protein ABIZ56_00725, partial [Chthoniobacteraceae bacterium]
MKKYRWLWLTIAVLLTGNRGFAGDSFDDLAQDGRGVGWAISSSRSGHLARRNGAQWEWVSVDELRDVRPVRLAALRDGAMACLWVSGDEKTGALSRHREGEPPDIVRFAVKLKEPRLLERRDNSLVMTERGPTVIQVRWGEEAGIITMPEELFRKPTKQSESNERSFAPIRALEDADGRLYLWSFALDSSEYQWRLASFAITAADGGFARLEVEGLDADARLSDVGAIDARSLWVAKVGTGLFRMDLEARRIEPLAVPEPDAFAYIEQIFREGEDTYVVTCPRPSEFDSPKDQVRIAGRVSLSMQTFFDERLRTGGLFRYRNLTWKLLINGLDGYPRFGNWERPRARTDRSLLVGAAGSGPWVITHNEERPPVPLDWMQDFPLSGADRFTLTPAGEMLALSSGVVATASIKAKRDPEKLRVQELKTHLPLLRDARGQLWGFPKDFAAWNGERWIDHALPQELVKAGGWSWLPDAQNRGWLFTGSGKIGICDFDTGEWMSFPSLHAALEAQLPKGSVVHDAQNPFLSAAFSGDGKIAFFELPNHLRYFANAKWRSWDLREIGGNEASLDGSPYFNKARELCVPLTGRIHQWSDKDQKWTRFESPDEPVPSTRPQRIKTAIPADCPIKNPASSAIDYVGVCWLIDRERVLHKAIVGRSVRALDESEPNPFRYGAQIHSALIDIRGNAFLDTTDFGQTHRYVF